MSDVQLVTLDPQSGTERAFHAHKLILAMTSEGRERKKEREDIEINFFNLHFLSFSKVFHTMFSKRTGMAESVAKGSNLTVIRMPDGTEEAAVWMFLKFFYNGNVDAFSKSK
jgi:hypothetical protein